MKNLILSISLLMSFKCLSQELYGCDTLAIEQASKQAALETNLTYNEAKSIAILELVSFDETYGRGEFVILIQEKEYPISTFLWEDYSCSLY